MRVLVIPKWYPWPPERPVFGIFCREHACALALKHDVVVLASDAVRQPPFAAFSLSDGVEDGLRTLRLRYRRPLARPAGIAAQTAGMLSALRLLRREGWAPDIVHAHVFSAGLPALALGRVARAPVVITEHYTGFQRGLITGYDRFTAWLAFGAADLVAPVSGDLARHVHEIQPRARIRVVENVVDTGSFHPGTGPDSKDGPLRLLTVAALTEKKGHADLFAALGALGAGFRLDLVGDGELRAELEQLAVSCGLGGVVRFHGARPKEDVAQLMREADLFVLPSHFENLPCVLIEAMASGLPAVATAVGGVPSLLEGTGAVLCPPRDPAALSEAIRRSLARRDDVDPQALAARARQRFGYETIAGIWTGIYETLRDSSGATS